MKAFSLSWSISLVNEVSKYVLMEREFDFPEREGLCMQNSREILVLEGTSLKLVIERRVLELEMRVVLFSEISSNPLSIKNWEKEEPKQKVKLEGLAIEMAPPRGMRLDVVTSNLQLKILFFDKTIEGVAFESSKLCKALASIAIPGIASFIDRIREVPFLTVDREKFPVVPE